MKEDAKPYALFTPRNVPIPLHGKVLGELNHIESLIVALKVSELTSWCAGLVVVPNKSGDVCLCVDHGLESSPREHDEGNPSNPQGGGHARTTVGSRALFTKLDAYSGFWQIPLEEESRLLMTFITPFVRYICL